MEGVNPTIVIYCDGTAGATHERFTVAAYERTHATLTHGPAAWIALRHWEDQQLRNSEERAAGGRRFRLRCDRCNLDDQRKQDDRGVDDQVFAVFDRLWQHRVNPLEISARGLLGLLPS